MRPPFRPVLLLLMCLALGCAGPARHTAARYTWLQKQGKRPPARPPCTVAVAVEVTAPDLPASVASGPADLPPPAEPPLEWAALGTVIPLAPAPPSAALTPRADHTFPPAVIAVQASDSTDYFTPEPRKWNGKAIAALPVAVAVAVLGIALESIPVLLVGGAIAFTLGLIGSRQCRDRRNRGQGLAFAGMVLGAAALFFCLVALLVAL